MIEKLNRVEQCTSISFNEIKWIHDEWDNFLSAMGENQCLVLFEI